MVWPEHLYISEKSKQLIIDHSQLYALELNQITQCGYTDACETFDISRSNPEKQIVLFSIHGSGIVTTPNSEHHLTANTVIYLPAHIPHRITLNSERWDSCWMIIEPQGHLAEQLPNGVQFQDSANAGLVKKIIDCIHHSMHSGYPLEQQMTALQVEQLRLLVTHRLPSAMTNGQIRLQKVFQRVQQQLHRNWSIADLAAIHPCSEPHFHRLCQQHLGRTPMAQLTHLRMEHASRMLISSDYPIQHICESIGYPNPANFSTRFKKWSTLTPRQYRQRFGQ